ncbi:MAG: nucleotide exchange factor GrpE [Candidatus Sumerlaeota bacterium]|nr:nucleotide exchange factor GrpE [Candidatus Sumerlaeota bacterium]
MRMLKRGSLVSTFVESEFAINEKPMEVSLAAGVPDQGAKGGNGSNNGRAEDLLASICSLMKEHEKMSDLASELKARSQTSDSFEPLMNKMLPLLDSFERVLFLARNHTVSDEVANWLKSVEAIYYRIFQLLESFGLVAIPAIGQTVNLDLHEVVEVASAPNRPAGVIIAERRKGYAFRGKLFRCAQVVVSEGINT